MQTEAAQADVSAHMAGPALERLPAMNALRVELDWFAAKSESPQASLLFMPWIAIPSHKANMPPRS